MTTPPRPAAPSPPGTALTEVRVAPDLGRTGAPSARPRHREGDATDGVVELYAAGVQPLHGGIEETTSPCQVCGRLGARPWLLPSGGRRLVRCPRCGTGRMDPLPDAADLADLYPAAYYGQGGRKFPWPVEAAVAAFARLQAAWLARGLARGESALDVGCGRGALLRGLAAHGLRAVGTELPGAAPELPAPCEVREVARLAEAGWEAGGFGLVVLWHVLEHLPDPRATLTEARRLLRPGVRLVVSVPNLDSVQARWAGPHWFHLDPPRHLHHFTTASLRALLEDLGFRVLGERHLSLRQNPFGWIQSALDKAGRWPRNALYESLLRGAPPTIPRRTRWLLLGLALAATPLAVVSSLIEAMLRRGGTVTLTAERQGASSEEDDLRDQMTPNN